MIRHLVLAAVPALLIGCGVTEPDPATTSTPAAAPAVDTVTPTAPPAPNATANSGTTVVLSWSPATDNVGVTQYRLLRCAGGSCTPNTVVATTESTSYVDGGLNAGATYGYRVTAVDAAGNVSPPSPKATVTTPSTATPPVADTVAPSIPGNVNATATSSATVAVSWSASTDNVGVSGYRVYRCAGTACTPTAQVASPSATGFADSGLMASTAYAYRVAAADAAGNVSGMSATVSVTTQAPPAPGAGLPSAAGWYQMANTKIESVCAATNGYSQVGGNSGCNGIFAWSGGAFDTKRNRMIVFGGGHGDYYGNELYALNLGNQTMTRLTNPGLPIASGCQEAIAGGTQPNSRHTYDGVEYMANVDRLFVFGGSLACSSGNWGQSTWTFDFTTMQWQNMMPGGAVPRGEAGMMTAYDPNTGRVYLHDRIHLYAYDFASNSYTRVSSSAVNLGYHLNATIDPKRKRFVIVGYDSSAGGGRVYSYDISGASANLVTVSTTGGSGIVGDSYPGLDYDPVSDRIVAWNGGAVYSLDLDTRTWTATTLAGAPANPSQAGSGTHGRWRYSPTSGVFVLVNEYNQNGLTFRLP